MPKKKQTVSDDLSLRVKDSKRIVRKLKAMRKELLEELRTIEIAIVRRTLVKIAEKKTPNAKS